MKKVKTSYFKANDAQKQGLLKKMLELKHLLYSRLSSGQFFRHAEAWEEVLQFANGDLGMTYSTLRKLKGAVAIWKGAAFKKFDQNG